MESDGRSGGLTLFCNKVSEIVINFMTENFIDMVFMSGNLVSWRLTGFYGEPSWEQRHRSWRYLRDLKGETDSAWLVMGDFNEILHASEKEGGNPRPRAMIQAFSDCLHDCGLKDVEYTGDKYTWRRGEIRERLDRAVCNEAWMEKFPLAMLFHEQHVHSDHRPIWIDTEHFDGELLRKRSGGLRFEAKWLQEETVEEIVKSAWERAKLAGIGPSLADRTRAVHADLHAWDRNTLKGPKKRISKLKRELEKLKAGPLNSDTRSRQKEVQVLLENILDQEELYWLQRGRANWLLHGDRNTAFFHKAAMARKKRNQIKKLMDDNGTWHQGSDELKQLISGYFINLFSSEVQSPDLNVLSRVHPRVTQEMNTALLATYTAEEVRKALFDIGDFKAPGPDGLHSVFYKRFWPMLGEDLVEEVLRAINTCNMPKGWNDTTIVMIDLKKDINNI